MEKDLSPEERLLRLIKGRSKKTKPEDSLPPQNARQNQIEVKEPDISPMPKTAPKPIKITAHSNYLFFEIILTVIIVLAAVLIIFSIITGEKKSELDAIEMVVKDITVRENIEKPLEDPKETVTAEKVKEERKESDSFADYEKLFSTKAVFAPVSGSEKTFVKTAGPHLKELVSDFRLVGIMPGEEPQAIIEEKKTGQTFFLQKGENIQGIEIMDILTGRVILGKGDETITLSL